MFRGSYFFTQDVDTSLNKWDHNLETAFCFCSGCLCLMLNFVWWPETSKGDKYGKKASGSEQRHFKSTVQRIKTCNMAESNTAVWVCVKGDTAE